MSLIIHCPPCNRDHQLTGPQAGSALQGYSTGEAQHIGRNGVITGMCLLDAATAFGPVRSSRRGAKREVDDDN